MVQIFTVRYRYLDNDHVKEDVLPETRRRHLGDYLILLNSCMMMFDMQVVSVGGLLAQSIGLLVLSWLFLTRNEYYKMSSLAHTGMLPTNRND